MNYKKILALLILVHSTLYLFLNHFVLEKKLYANYFSYTIERANNPYYKKVSEEIFFSSCGDEFFRNIEQDAKSWEEEFDYTQPYYNIYRRVASPPNYTELIKLNEDAESMNSVVFEVCKVQEIPGLYTKIFETRLYGEVLDLHGMEYNGQIKVFETTYIWLLFTWLEIQRIQIEP